MKQSNEELDALKTKPPKGIQGALVFAEREHLPWRKSRTSPRVPSLTSWEVLWLGSCVPAGAAPNEQGPLLHTCQALTSLTPVVRNHLTRQALRFRRTLHAYTSSLLLLSRRLKGLSSSQATPASNFLGSHAVPMLTHNATPYYSRKALHQTRRPRIECNCNMT